MTVTRPEMWNALRASAGQDAPPQGVRKNVLWRVLAGIVVAVLLLAAFLDRTYLGQKLLAFVIDNGVVIGSVLIGALGVQVIALVSSEIILFFPRWFKWTRDGKMMDRLERMERRQQELHAHHEDMLQALPGAIGGKFTRSLFAYGPATSEAIAEALSKKVQERYDWHYARVQVRQVHERYSVKAIETHKIGQQDFLFWKVEFKSMWWWKNDSRVPVHPLKSLRMMTAPGPGREDLLFPTADLHDRGQADEAFQDYMRRRNLLFTPLDSPAGPKEKLSSEEARLLHTTKRLKVKFGAGGQVHEIGNVDFVDALDELPHGGAYSIYRLNGELCDRGLGRDEEMSVELIGDMLILATQSEGNDQLGGVFTYPPSDIITEKFAALIDVPESLAMEGKHIALAINTDKEGGCGYYDRPYSDLKRDRFHTEGSTRGTLAIHGPIDEDFRFQLAWTGEKQKDR